MQKVQQKVIASRNLIVIWRDINPDVILPVKLKFYRQNKSCSYSTGKTNSEFILRVNFTIDFAIKACKKRL